MLRIVGFGQLYDQAQASLGPNSLQLGNSKGEKSSPRSKAVTWYYVLASGLFSLVIFLVAFSRPPLEQSSGLHYLAVVVFFLFLIAFWSLLSVGVNRLAGYSQFGRSVTQELFKAPVFASLAYGLALLLALFSFGTDTEIGYILAIFFLLIGFCLATAMLASHWAGRLKAPYWLVMGIAGLGGPGGLLISGWLSYTIFGEDFLYYDAMLFL